MMWRKVAAVLFGIMLLTTTLSFDTVAAENGVTVILVSDNEADCALAEYLANLTGAVVVTTTWGTYDPNVTAEVMSYAPDRVIILGGPEAVLEQYVEDLTALNITVERWGGANRYETNMMVLNNAESELGVMFRGNVFIVPGNDSAGIRVALREAVKVRGIIILANESSNVTEIIKGLKVRPENVTIVRNRAMQKIIERIRERLMEGNCNCSEIAVNMTAETALRAINASEEKIKIAEEMLMNVTLPEQKKILAEKMLNLSKTELERAKEAYNQSDYGRAYGLAIASKSHAEFTVKIASKEWEFRIKINKKMGLKVRLMILERQLKVLEMAGLNTSQVRALLDAAREALMSGDVDVAITLVAKAQMLLRELYIGERVKIRGSIHVPFRGHREP